MVPNGWTTLSLGEITKEKISYGIVQAGPHVENGVPYIKSSNVGGEIKIEDLQRTSSEIHHKYRRSAVHPNDIVFSLRGNIGRTSIVPPELLEANLTQGTARISVNTKNETNFVYYSLASIPILNKINSLSKGSTFKEISLEELRKVKLPIPPLPEQQKIAKILSTWDKAISTTERLIENSTQQKKALMQQLLTGKKRLFDELGNRFEGEWEELKLENVFKLSSGDTKPKDVENEPTEEQKIPVFGGNNIMGYSANSNSEGDVILIGRVGEYCGVTRLIQEKCWITDNALFTKEFSEEFDRLFIVYLLQNFQLSRLRNKGGQPQVSQKPIYNLKLKIPLLQEQQKIATVLTNADNEIELLEQQLADLQQEKKALMQQLLTGKRRVVVDGDNLA